MNVILCCLYLGTCAYVAGSFANRSGFSRSLGCTVRAQTALAIFFLVFFGCFHILGYLSLLTGKGLVEVGYALLIAVLLAVLTGLAMKPLPTDATSCRSSVRTVFRNRTVAFTLAVFFLAGLLAVCGYPQGFEVSTYHLPNAVNILQTHSLTSWDGNFPHTFPANSSIFSAFFLGFLPEKLVSATNLVFLAPLACGIFLLSRRAGADRNASLLVCCGLLSMPVIAFSSVELSADIGGLAFIVLGMSFLLGEQIHRRTALFLAGTSAGLALGFKSMHLLSIAFMFLVILGSCTLQDISGPQRVRKALMHGGVFLAGTVVACGFWLVRNYLMFDNPLYPVNVPLLGNLLEWRKAHDVDFSNRQFTQLEWVKQPADWLSYPWVEGQVAGQNFKHSSGLGAFFAASVPVSILVTAGALGSGKLKQYRTQFILLSGVVFIMAAWWFLNDRQPRYAFAAFGYCMPLVAWTLTCAHQRWRRYFDALLIACIAVMLSVFLIKEGLLFVDKILLSGHTTRAKYYEYPEQVDRLPAGATILNLSMRSWHYPLAGAHLTNRVISMQEGRRIAGLPPSLGAPQSIALRAATLAERGITHIFVTGADVKVDQCMQLEEVGRLDKNPKNGEKLKVPRLLYAVVYDRTWDPERCAPLHQGPEARQEG